MKRTGLIDRALTIVAALLLTPAAASAAELVCSGQVRQINYHAPDRFMLQLDSMNVPVFICNPNATWTVAGTGYTTSAESCKALVATFLSAKMSGRAFSAVYFDGADVPGYCGSWPSWHNANVRYFAWAD